LLAYIFRSVNSYWRYLDPDFQDEWNYYALTYPQYSVHNPTVPISGQNLFTMWNIQRCVGEQNANLIRAEVEAILYDLDVVNLAISLVGGTVLQLSPSYAPGDGNWLVNYYATPPVSPGTNYFKSKFRFVSSYISITTPIDITANYVKNVGALPQVGNKLGLRAVLFHIDGGRVMPPVDFSVIVA
jgi:hypothetical protein